MDAATVMLPTGCAPRFEASIFTFWSTPYYFSGATSGLVWIKGSAPHSRPYCLDHNSLFIIVVYLFLYKAVNMSQPPVAVWGIADFGISDLALFFHSTGFSLVYPLIIPSIHLYCWGQFCSMARPSNFIWKGNEKPISISLVWFGNSGSQGCKCVTNLSKWGFLCQACFFLKKSTKVIIKQSINLRIFL